MQVAKYYDYEKNRPLDLEEDGCELKQWESQQGQFRFAKHPDGFLVFLAHEKLDISDEYSDSDPYSVEENIDGKFHNRRIELTVELVQEAVSSNKSGVKVLDLGCGEGHITEKIRQALSGSEVTGLDYALSAIEYAHEHFPKVDFAVGDAYDLPYAEGFFDVVVCNNLWEHVPDPLLLLNGMKKVLKPGGHMIISTPSRYRIGNLGRVLLGKPIKFMSHYHVTEYTVGQVKEQLEYGGFEVRKATSRSISGANLKEGIARFFFSKFISLVGSHHQLEATVFYLAQRVK